MTVQATAAYFNVVSTVVEDRLGRDLRVPLREDLERATEWMSTSGRGRVALEGLDVGEITVERDRLRFIYEITTSIK